MLVSKSSTDLDGISVKLLKAVRSEIESPLVHAFNLSLTTGEFPHRLKASKVVPKYPYTKQVTEPTVTTTDLSL
jgi:hypothetical protein